MMSAMPWLQVVVPLANFPDAKKQNETAALQEGEVDAEPGGMLPQDVAVLNLGTPMHKSLLFLKPMVNITY